ncbi:MAG: HAD family phosphatase [Dehalococcoidales bacterium]|nr:HAD family phosphatase [Dehalococcoidales bacterium]
MPENKLKAAIWDMDGVIADTAPYHYQAWRETFRKRGFNFSEEAFKRHFGQRNDTIIKTVIGDISSKEFEAAAAEKEADYRRRVNGNIKALPGAIELMKALRERGVKMAVASSAPMENIKLILDALGISGYFQAIVWGREVTEGKPSPQAFLLAAKKLGIKPENCVVFEDAIAGVAGAKTAGMKCVAITNTHPRGKLEQADLVIESLVKIGLDDLEKLFGN